MNKNEIRGYIFLGFALLCYCTAHISHWFSNSLLIMMILFVVLALIFLMNAFGDAWLKTLSPKKTDAPLGVKQSWTEVNLFQVKLDKVAVEQNENGYSCEAVFTAENWRTELKSGGNKMTIQPKAIAEQGAETYEIDNPESSFTVEAGKHLQFVCPLKAAEHTERVLLELTVTFDDGDAIYKAEFEFYPGHYVR